MFYAYGCSTTERKAYVFGLKVEIFFKLESQMVSNVVLEKIEASLSSFENLQKSESTVESGKHWQFSNVMLSN